MLAFMPWNKDLCLMIHWEGLELSQGLGDIEY